ncbi:MAG TPA: DegT/DnrJ/EryC1/StrS family aminotransferase [Candidatus Binatia bacterium]
MTATREIPFGRPWINDDDRRAVLEVLHGPILTHGPQCQSFEEEFATFLGPGAHCVTVSSCTAALHLAYLQFGIGPGDDVLVPAQTHTATAHAVELVGARPVFVDCDPTTGNVTADGIEAAITSRTKALSVVHFVGIPCDMPAIMSVAERHGLKVVEDCATALGARWGGKHVGLFGDAGGFSFYPVKHITTGEGGMFVSRHPQVAQAVGKLRAFGVDRTHGERSVPGMYDVLTLGLNYRMSEMQAALGRTQLNRIRENLDRRRANFKALKDALETIPGLSILDARGAESESSNYCLSVALEGDLKVLRNDIVQRLNAAGVGTSVYYPQPVPRLRYYRDKYGYDAGRFQHAAQISDGSVALPVGPHIDGDAMGEMTDKVKKIISEVMP